MATSELCSEIQEYSPEQCANLVTKPSSEIYYALKQRIQKCDPPWVRGFVDQLGLDRLVDTLVLLSQDRQKAAWTSVCDAILQLDCIGCIRELLNFSEGLGYIIQNSQLIDKLVIALDTPNVYPKKQIFELLTCITLATEKGHYNVLSALENYKKVKHQTHEFTVILHEIKLAENTHYRTTLLAFINALVQCTSNLRDRCRLRNQFIGLKILDVINFVKKDEKDAEFCIQMQVFYNSKHADETEMSESHNFDIHNTNHVFNAINDKLVGSPEASDFLHVLQDLYRMDTSSCDRSLLWQTLEKVTYTISNIESEKDTQHILSHIYTAFDSGISSQKNIVSEEICEQSLSCDNNNSIPINEDDLMEEVLSGSPEFRFSPSGDNRFPMMDAESNDRRDSGVSMRSNPSPSGCYSDYDNIGENLPVSDVFIQQQYLPSNKRYPPNKELYHQYHTLPAIEETELDCIDISNDEDNKNDNDKLHQGEKYGELIRPRSLEIIKKTVKTETYPGESSVIDDQQVILRPKSLETVHDTNGNSLRSNGNTNNGSKKEMSLFRKMCQDRMAAANQERMAAADQEQLDAVNQGYMTEANTNNNSNQRCSVTKDVKWVPVPQSKARNSLSMWNQMKEYGHKDIHIDMTKVQNEFVDVNPQSIRHVDDELTLLSGDTSLGINLFLARLETNPDYVVGCVREGELEELGIEAVKHLLHVLPSDEEIAQVRSYTENGGSLYDLALPEQLLILLSSIPGYKLQLEAMMFHSDFETKYCRLYDAFDALLKACRDTIHCHRLRDFMRCALKVGNFLNKDSHIGQVDGIALSTWQRMAQVSSSSGDYESLLTWLIRHVCDKDEGTMSFVNDISTLEKAASCDIEEMKSEVSELNLQMKKFVSKLSQVSLKTRRQYDKIMESVTRDLQTLQDQIQGVKYASSQLMAYLCENETTFDVQKCIRILNDFILLVKRLKKESIDREVENQLAGRRVKQMIDKQIDQYFADIFYQNDVTLSETPQSKRRVTHGIIDRLLEKLHQGNMESNYLENHQATDYKHLRSFIMPEHIEERFSPDREVAPIIPSQSTPSKPDESLLEIPELKELEEKKTYADKADLYLKQQYRKEKQALSSSFVAPESPSKDSIESSTEERVIPRSKIVERKEHISQYDNFQDMDVILLDLDTCADKVNHEIQKLEDAKKTIAEQAAAQQTKERPAGGEAVNVDSGVKFFFGLPTPHDLKQPINNEGAKDLQQKIEQQKKEEVVEKAKMDQENPREPTNNKSKPGSKLGILKRFSKAVLRQRDGNIVTKDTDNKPVKRPTSDPVYANTTAVQQQLTRAKSIDVTAGKTKGEKSTVGKENSDAAPSKRFGFGGSNTTTRENSFKLKWSQKPKKLTKSLSQGDSDQNGKQGGLKKTNSVPSALVDPKTESNRFLDTKGPDRPVNKQLKFNAVNIESNTEGGVSTANIESNTGGGVSTVNIESGTGGGLITAAKAGEIPVANKQRTIPSKTKPGTSGQNRPNVTNSKDTVISNKLPDVINNGSKGSCATTTVDSQQITIKASYQTLKDQKSSDKVQPSKTFKYKSSTLPIQKTSKLPTGVQKEEDAIVRKDKKKITSIPAGSNRFGFGKKDKKGASERESIGGAAVIPTAPKHEVQQAEKCTLKIYRRYNLP